MKFIPWPLEKNPGPGGELGVQGLDIILSFQDYLGCEIWSFAAFEYSFLPSIMLIHKNINLLWIQVGALVAPSGAVKTHSGVMEAMLNSWRHSLEPWGLTLYPWILLVDFGGSGSMESPVLDL